ncbi:hypothetical protein GN956_G5949 [Arapaima gigas]
MMVQEKRRLRCEIKPLRQLNSVSLCSGFISGPGLSSPFLHLPPRGGWLLCSRPARLLRSAAATSPTAGGRQEHRGTEKDSRRTGEKRAGESQSATDNGVLRPQPQQQPPSFHMLFCTPFAHFPSPCETWQALLTCRTELHPDCSSLVQGWRKSPASGPHKSHGP